MLDNLQTRPATTEGENRKGGKKFLQHRRHALGASGAPLGRLVVAFRVVRRRSTGGALNGVLLNASTP